MLQNFKPCFNSAARSDHKQCSLQLEVECVRRDWRGWSGRYGWRGGWVWLSMAPACVCVCCRRGLAGWHGQLCVSCALATSAETSRSSSVRSVSALSRETRMSSSDVETVGDQLASVASEEASKHGRRRKSSPPRLPLLGHRALGPSRIGPCSRCSARPRPWLNRPTTSV